MTPAMGYPATPAAMSGVVVTAYKEMLLQHGMRRLAVDLVAIAARTEAAPDLEGPARPAEEALQAAFEGLRGAFRGAMDLHGMLPATATAIEAQVEQEIADTVREVIEMREQRHAPVAIDADLLALEEQGAQEDEELYARMRAGQAAL